MVEDCSFFFNDTATTEIYTYIHTLSLHDALPIYAPRIAGDHRDAHEQREDHDLQDLVLRHRVDHRCGDEVGDRKSTRLNSSHQCAPRMLSPRCEHKPRKFPDLRYGRVLHLHHTEQHPYELNSLIRSSN